MRYVGIYNHTHKRAYTTHIHKALYTTLNTQYGIHSPRAERGRASHRGAGARRTEPTRRAHGIESRVYSDIFGHFRPIQPTTGAAARRRDTCGRAERHRGAYPQRYSKNLRELIRGHISTAGSCRARYRVPYQFNIFSTLPDFPRFFIILHFPTFFNPVFFSFLPTSGTTTAERLPTGSNTETVPAAGMGTHSTPHPNHHPRTGDSFRTTEPTERNVHPRAWAHAEAFNEPAERFRAHGEPLNRSQK